MSTRVSLIITSACLAFAASLVFSAGAAGQISRPAPRDAATPNWAAGDPESVELISNAPRAVSYAENVASPGENVGGEALPTAPHRPLSRATSDSTHQREAMPLPPRSKQKSRQASSGTGSSSGRALVTVLSSLAIVLVVFFVFVWLTRSAAPKGMAPLSKEVVESLGRAPLLGRQQMQLIRVGNKLILLSVTATGADTLTEITDPVEVDRLAGLCRQAQAGSISDTFRQVLAQASAEPAAASRGEQRPSRRAGSMEPHRA